ncbi:MAG TPA: ABC transporter ATP-binding protein, partial [Thermoleophilia bacterium]|nr:ABC transporter ATP-binding protein [Thermoleophilia bacterium]
ARRVGLVFQDPEDQAVMTTVEREIAFGLENLGVDSDAITRLVEEALISLGLSRLRHAPLAELSGGELQKVALAGVIATQPHLLLLDEPTSQLDPVSSEELLADIRRLSEDTGATIVLAEHRVERCLHLATRVLYMEDGAVAIDAPPQEFAAWALRGHRELLPPVARLFARRLNGRAEAHARSGHLPLTVKDARHMLDALDAEKPARRADDEAVAEAHASATADEIVLETERLTVGYDGETPLLEDVVLRLRRAELVAFMGENGVGKSTLVRHFNGLLTPRRGRVTLLGRDVAGLSVAEAARSCALLGQNPGDYFVRDTVAEEIDYTLAQLGLDGARRNALAARIIAELDLAGLLDRDPRSLSGGERTRVALAAVTCGDPPVIVLDEPTRGMDPAHKLALTATLRRWAAAGRCVVVVTHDVEFAARCASRVVVLGDGGVLADGTTADVLNGALFFSTQVNRLLRHALPGILYEDEVVWGVSLQ